MFINDLPNIVQQSVMTALCADDSTFLDSAKNSDGNSINLE
jgi:hypothetical protein